MKEVRLFPFFIPNNDIRDANPIKWCPYLHKPLMVKLSFFCRCLTFCNAAINEKGTYANANPIKSAHISLNFLW